MDARRLAVRHCVTEATQKTLTNVASAGVTADPLADDVIGAICETYVQISIEGKISAQDVTIELDLFLRESFDELLDAIGNDVALITSAASPVRAMIQLSIGMGSALQRVCDVRQVDSGLLLHLQKLPFILIEDLLCALTIAQVQRVWDFVETLIMQLYTTSFFSKGQLLALKSCNTVLKKLSKSMNTEFCGRILMLLSAIYPITDRSALNIGGEVNTSSMSTFETEEEFTSNSLLYGAAPTAVPDAMEIEQKVGEDGEEPEVAFDERAPSYPLYSAFWGLQTTLCGALPKPDPVSNAMGIDASSLTTFLSDVRLVLSVFDSVKLAGSGAPSKQLHLQADESSYMGCKYLTSSQLFVLQLRDPALRVQVLSQILCYLKYLRSRPFEVRAMGKDRESSSLFRELDEAEVKACALLGQVSPYGEDIKQVVATLLEREIAWIRWKAVKPTPCPEFVRPSLEKIHASRSEDFVPLKRKRGGEPSGSSTFFFENSDQSIKEASKRLLSGVPSFEEHIREYLDAEDPDAGIDEEYHPKQNSVYCWRAMRLLAVKDVTSFERMGDGDISKGLQLSKSNKPEKDS